MSTTRRVNGLVMKGALSRDLHSTNPKQKEITNTYDPFSQKTRTSEDRACSSSLKLSRLPPPDLRLSCIIKPSSKHAQLLEQLSRTSDVCDVRRNGRLARATTPPSLLPPRTAQPPAAFDFFESRPDKRYARFNS